MVVLKVLQLPRPVQDEETLKQCVLRMKSLRLEALQADPDSWISRYDSERVQPLEFWLDRLQDPHTHHLVMVKTSSVQTSPAQADQALLLQYDWVGFLVLVDTNKGCEWFMAAVYLDKSLRGRGFGKQLVQAAIRTIALEKERSGSESAICITNVRHGNDRPLELYKQMGFRVSNADAVEEEDGQSYHATSLRLEI